MYRLFYDGEVLHDPRDDKRRVTECKVELESNTAGTLTFKIAPAHPLFGKLQAMDTGHEVTVMDDTVEVFRGRIKSDGKDMQTVTNVTCEGQLAYLNDSVVRAYGTYASDDENWTVVKGDNIFRWYVSQHNGQSDANKQFVIGKCETGYGLTRSSTQHPTTGQEIKEKLLDALSCYIDCYMDNGERILDLLEFGGADAEQSIEFGTNLLDYATTRDASSIITDIIPTGTDNDNNAIDITSLRDGDYGSCYKEGDHVSFSAGVNLYGHITEARSYDGTTPTELLNASINDLQTSSEVIESVNINAVDLHNVDPTVKPIRLNEWVLVSSKPHGVYQSMMCVKMTIDINDPTRTVYTFGATLPSLTSDNAMKVAQNRQRQEEMIVAAAAISVDAKAAAELATTAQMAANTAQTAANTAQSTADTAKTTADTAQTTADTAQGTADKAQATADNIEVGGRNLILDSKTNFDNSNYPTGKYDLSEELRRGETYTYQIKGTLAEGSTGWLFYSDKGESFGALHDYEKYDSDKGIYYQTFLCRDVQTSPTDIIGSVNIYPYPNQTGKIATIEWVKLEKGNKATDWTPAPEDVDASITAVDSKVTTISTRTSTLENTTTGMKSDVSALQTTIKTKADNSTVTSVDNKVSTLTNTVNGLSSTVSSVSSVANSAANSANNAQITADNNYNKVKSRGSENLITNGSGFMGDNTNFPGFAFTAKETYGCPGGFYRDFSSGFAQLETSEYFPVDISQNYKLNFWLKSTNTAAYYYTYVDQYDVDKKQINITNSHFINGSTTTLSQDLNNGDTVVHFTDLTGWIASLTQPYNRGFIIWNYKNASGYQYEPETYSRNVFDGLYANASSIDKTAKTITLSNPWAYGTVKTGTSLSQSTSGGTFLYLSSGYYPSDWTNETGLAGPDRNPFWAGTAFCKIGWFWNYARDHAIAATGTGYFSNMTFGIDNANQADLDATNKNVTAITTRTATLETNVNAITGRVTATETVANTAKTNASTAQTAANNAQSTANTANSNAGKAQNTANTANATANTATSNLTALTARVSTAESKLTATALTTTISSALTGSNAISTTKFVMDKDGLLIKNGGLSIQNNAGTTVLSADVAGNLTFTGALNGATGTFRGALTAYNSSGKLLMQASAGRINFYDGVSNVVTGYVDSDLTANTNNISINGNGLITLSVSGTSVLSIAQNRCNVYKPILYQGALVTMPRIYAGTAVRDAGGGNSVPLISLSQINSWFGINNASAVNTAVFVSNGDGAASNAHCQDATFLGGEWWATFDRTGVTTIRINYLVVCWA
jgi:methyl-accepting chemotaxis protein